MSKIDTDTEPQIPGDLKGWAWFEETADKAKAETLQEKQVEEETFYYHFQKCFSTPDGQFVLEHLQKFMDRYSDFDPELGFYNGAAYGFYRQGQKSMCLYLNKLAKGKPNGGK